MAILRSTVEIRLLDFDGSDEQSVAAFRRRCANPMTQMPDELLADVNIPRRFRLGDHFHLVRVKSIAVTQIRQPRCDWCMSDCVFRKNASAVKGPVRHGSLVLVFREM